MLRISRPLLTAHRHVLCRGLRSLGGHSKRLQSNDALFRVSTDVQDAISSKKPVVALETAIYTHGFPYPDNVLLASHLEDTVRRHGAVPATIGVLDGVALVGMDADELTRLAGSAGQETTVKISRRDLAYTCGLGLASKKLNGGTTIAGTMVLAHLAGIKVFASGGLGGVHRGGESSLDISADLTELGRTSVTVISSGCKSFLDIPRTLEYLETQGVGVATFADGRVGTVDFPAFWTRDSGIKSPMVIRDEAEAAAIIYAQSMLPLSSGLHFANPIPHEHSIPRTELDEIIEQAVQEALERGMSGKDNTPFILSKIKELTRGNSILVNRALIESNVIRGAKVAVELAKLESSNVSQMRCDLHSHQVPVPTVPMTGQQSSQSCSTYQMPATKVTEIDVLVAGALAIDSACDFSPLPDTAKAVLVSPDLRTSNPAVITQTLGGVGHNIATAIHQLGIPVRLCSFVADDPSGRAALAMMADKGMPTNDIKVLPLGCGKRTSQYVAVNDSKKDLVIAMADMAILDVLKQAETMELFQSTVSSAMPKWLVVDANWSTSSLKAWLSSGKASGASVAFEPVSIAKSARLFLEGHAASENALGVFPNHHVDLATPNSMELAAMHHAAREKGFFERQDWWRVVDSLGISSTGARDRLVSLTGASIVDQGIPQQSIQLLPLMPCILTKMGAQGVLLTELLRAGDERITLASAAPYILCRSHDGNEDVGGVYMRYFPSVKVHEKDIISVNGVGDTFLGVLMAGLASGQVHGMDRLIELAQKGSVMTLKSKEAVSPDLGALRAELRHDQS